MALTIDEEIELLKLYEEEDLHRDHLWRSGQLRYKLHAAQKLIYDTVAKLDVSVRDVVLYCARRFGKSYLIVVMALEDCLRNPGCFVRIIGPTLDDTMEIVEFNMEKIIRDAPPGLIKPQLGRRRWKVGNSYLVIGGFDKKNVRKNLGKEAIRIYTEEAGASKSEEFAYGIREVVSPQLFHTKGRMIHGTTPPPDLDHIFETEFVPAANKAGTLFRFTINDNPLADDEMRAQAIKDSGGINTVAYKRNYLVQSVKDPGVVVLPSFDSRRHVKPLEIPLHCQWLLMGDWGGVRDRTWLAVGYWDFERAKLCVVAEADFDPNTSTKVIAPVLRDLETLQHPPKDPKYPWPKWVDCHGQTQVDLFKDHEIVVQLPQKDDFDASINQLELAFLNDRIEISPNCPQLIATCEYGRFNSQRTDFLRSVALGHCDAVAGLMYGWRMVDKVTNPFPKKKYNREDYFEPYQIKETEESLEQVGKLFKQF